MLHNTLDASLVHWHLVNIGMGEGSGVAEGPTLSLGGTSSATLPARVLWKFREPSGFVVGM